MAFDMGKKDPVTALPQAPDFTASMAAYTKMVEDLSVQIKAAQATLADLQNQITQAKLALQEQYKQRLSDVGNQLTVLQAQLVTLQAESDALDQQISDKQATLAGISLDNTAKQKALDDEWLAVQKSSADVATANQQLIAGQKALADAQDAFEAEKAAFEADKAIQLANIAAEKIKIADLQAKADTAQQEVAITLQQASSALADVQKASEDLDAKKAATAPILAQADAVTKQQAANAAQLALNSAQASRNDTDAQEIRVAKVALNNKEKELDARQQMIDLAEKKIANS